MNKLRANRIMLSISACWAAINGELGLPMNGKLRFLDSVTLLWSVLIFCTSSLKFLAKDLSLNITRGVNFKQSKEPTLCDLMTINYLPRINDFEKLYYGLVSVSIGTSLFWRLYLRFHRRLGLFRAVEIRSDTGSDAKRNLMRFFYQGPSVDFGQAARPTKAIRFGFIRRGALSHKGPTSSGGGCSKSILPTPAQLEWLKLFECRTVIRDLAGCSEEFSRNFRSQLSDSKAIPGRANALTVLHGAKLVSATEVPHQRTSVRELAERDRPQDEWKLTKDDDIYLNPVRTYNFLRDRTWTRWNFIARNLRYILLFIGSLTAPIMYFTIVGLHSVMRNFSYEQLDSNAKLALYCYGLMEQVYACTQAALFFIFTNIFITIFHADILYWIGAIERELRYTIEAYQPNTRQAPKMLIYYIQFRLWAIFDYIKQIDNFVSIYSLVSMSTFMIGLSFGQSFLRVEERALKTGTAAVMFANFSSFTFLYVISWDIERRSSRLHGLLVSIASHNGDLILKRLWQKTLLGFFERDARRTFTLANMYPLNLDSWFKTIFGWLTMSLLINRLFHKDSWESTSASPDLRG